MPLFCFVSTAAPWKVRSEGLVQAIAVSNRVAFVDLQSAEDGDQQQRLPDLCQLQVVRLRGTGGQPGESLLNERNIK